MGRPSALDRRVSRACERHAVTKWIPRTAPAENFGMQHEPRRHSPRIGIEALCWEVIGNREVSSLIVDLSSEGARLERPFVPVSYREEPIELGPAGRSTYVPPPALPERLDRVPLQIEVPGIDEIMWARGDVVFDELVEAKVNGGPFGLVRRTGYHISLAAARDLRMLRELVWETYAKQRAANDEASEGAIDWARVACYR